VSANQQSNSHVRTANAIGHPVDRFAFVVAAAFALSALAYAITRHAPARFDATFGWEIGCCIRLSAAVAPGARRRY
jgi:hypothetical protein